MRIPKLAGKLCLLVVSLLLCVGVLEIALRVYAASQRGQTVARNEETGEPLHVVLDSPIIFGLNPKHPDVSAQGLRNDEVAVPKPEGLWRILVLGDSVTYGTRVDMEKAYPARLEEFLASSAGPVEVINAGVSGYTPYNELQYYLTRGRELEPDVVVVGFCMNDVANPRLHWDYTGDFIDDVPDEAIPNVAYDRELTRNRDGILNRSALYGAMRRGAQSLFDGDGDDGAGGGDDGLLTYITGEDSLSIEVYLDETSPEWRWLTSMYDQLHEAVAADGADLVIVIFPLSYQLDPGYPHMPQENLTEYCRSRSIASLDLLPRFRENPFGGYYLELVDGTRDAWHLSERGHRLTAAMLGELLQEKR